MKEIIQAYQPRPLGQEKEYSVLIPIIQVNGEPHVLYQVRSETIPQPGEVSFPGGQVEAEESYEAASIRETTEELQINAEQIEIWGEIDFLVHRNRTIHCFVGELQIEDWKKLSPNADEVDHLFIVPLAELQATEPVFYPLEMQVVKEQDFPFDRIRGGIDYPFSEHARAIPFYELADHTIWGMTALLTHRFIQILNENKKG